MHNAAMNVVAARRSIPSQCIRLNGFAVHGAQPVNYRGAALPRGYFCAVTPP